MSAANGIVAAGRIGRSLCGLACAVCLALLMSPDREAAALEQLGTENILACFEDHSGKDQMDVMRHLAIAALEGDKSAYDAGIDAFGMMVEELAYTHCAMNRDQLEDPQFVSAVEKYGAWLGQRLNEEIRAKIHN